MFAPLSDYSYRRMVFVLLACLAGMAFVSLLNGAMKLPLRALFVGEGMQVERAVIWHIRLPRILLCMIVGGGLAYAGAAIQGLFRNPLAEPGLIGVASGSALGASLFIVLFAQSVQGYLGLYGINAFAFAGACVSGFLVLGIVQRWSGGSVLALLLVGLAFNAIAEAGRGLLTYISDDEQLREAAFWTMGSFGRAEWGNVIVTVSLMLPAAFWLQRFSYALNLAQLGEREMEYTGVDSGRIKRHVVITTSVMVGSAVAAAGIIGFVGLVVPHLVRLVIGANHCHLMPLSFLVGSILVVGADTLARLIIAPAEMPVGILTSLLGGPFFLWLLYRQLGGAEL